MNNRRTWRTIALLLPFVHLPLQAQWVQLPGPFGGSPQDFLVQGSSLYVATDGDGVYRSVDSGATWTPSSTGLVQQRVRSLAALGANLIGRRVAVLADGPMEPGDYQVTWDAGHAPSGVYVYTLTAGGYSASRTMILLK